MRRNKLIQQAIRWRIFRQTIREARAAFADVSPGELQKMIDEAVEAVRSSQTSSPEVRNPFS